MFVIQLLVTQWCYQVLIALKAHDQCMAKTSRFLTSLYKTAFFFLPTPFSLYNPPSNLFGLAMNGIPFSIIKESVPQRYIKRG